MNDILTEVNAGVGMITLARPQALNALTLQMIRDLTATLLEWEQSASVQAVALRGLGKGTAPGASAPFGAFCAGGDIRFFHRAALEGDPQLEDFFTEEYRLDHLIHRFPKPFIAFMDGIVMGGGMGIAGHCRSSATLRIVTERTKMAMPETNIGLFPDVGGGYFLSRCPGRIGEYLALTGQVIGAAEAVYAGLADVSVDSERLEAIWRQLGVDGFSGASALCRDAARPVGANALESSKHLIDRYFALPTVTAIITALEADETSWASDTAALLRKRSPLMLHVVLAQVRKGRELSLANELRMERGMVRRCFHLRPGAASETVEGIRALAVDKDHRPNWNPSRIEDVTPEMVDAFFASPWPDHAHPLRSLA
jgi:enoyl-CoA hydratase/carnithine racemase